MNVFSPCALAAISYAVFLLSWLIPPDLYRAYMGEPDQLFLDPASILLYTLCVAFFVGGFWLADTLFPVPFLTRRQIETRTSPAAFIVIPLAVGTVFCVESTVLLVRAYPSLVLLLFSQQGYEIKQDLDPQQPLGLAAMWLVPIVWWALWRFPQLGLRGRGRQLAKIAIALAIASIVISASLRLSRGELMPVVVGIVLVCSLEKIATRKMQPARVARYALVFVLCMGTLFLGFSFLRGTQDSSGYAKDLLSYSVASYNRLAAIVNGRLRYPYAGRGVYLSGFLSFNSSFNRVVPIAQAMNWPNFMDVWSSEFRATWQAGLDGDSIWSGTFGYLFSDLGWFAPLLLFIYGFLYGMVWRSIKRGKVLGLVLYPWFAFCILFWFGTNYLFDTKIVVLLLVGVMLMAYEAVMAKRRCAPVGAGQRIAMRREAQV